MLLLLSLLTVFNFYGHMSVYSGEAAPKDDLAYIKIQFLTKDIRVKVEKSQHNFKNPN